jgi:hypothetical protein
MTPAERETLLTELMAKVDRTFYDEYTNEDEDVRNNNRQSAEAALKAYYFKEYGSEYI